VRGKGGIAFFLVFDDWVTSGAVLARDWNFKELLFNKLRFTWGWADVLSMDHIVQILNWAAWPEVFYTCICPYNVCIEVRGVRSALGDGPQEIQNDQKFRFRTTFVCTCGLLFQLFHVKYILYNCTLLWYPLSFCSFITWGFLPRGRSHKGVSFFIFSITDISFATLSHWDNQEEYSFSGFCGK